MKKYFWAVAIVAAAFFVLAVPIVASAADSDPRQPATAYATFRTAGGLDAPSPEPARQFETADLTSATPPADQIVIDGRVDFGDVAVALIGALGLFLLRTVPSAIGAYLNGKLDASFAKMLVDGTEAAITFGINATKGAVKDKALSIEVGNQVVETALEYSKRLFPDLIAKFGGEAAQRQRLQARVTMEANAQFAVAIPPAARFEPAPEPATITAAAAAAAATASA